MIEKNEGLKGTIILDDRYSPLIVTTFVGELELFQGQWYEEVSQRLSLREATMGRRLALIHDASRSTRANAEMRKFWADMSKRTASVMEARTLSSLVVVSNPIIRGVITAVGWLNPEVAKVRTVPSIEAAIAESLERLASAGTPVRLPPGGYQLPGHLTTVSTAV